MKLAAIHMAKALAFFEPLDLNPKGAVAFSDIIKALVERYKFETFPQKPEDFDQTKGLAFGAGRFERVVIDALTIYLHGITLDTRSSTEDSKRTLEEILQWAGKSLGLVYDPSMINNWQYSSQVTFLSDFSLTDMHPAIRQLADGVTKAVGEIASDKPKYESIALVIDHDPLTRKHILGRFSIQRRENEPFSANKYFSDAPLPTDVHIRLLEQFEAHISKNKATSV